MTSWSPPDGPTRPIPVTTDIARPDLMLGNTDGLRVQADLATNTLDYATYLGGSDDDRPTGVDVNGSPRCGRGRLYAIAHFPTTPDALLPLHWAGSMDLPRN